MAVSAPRYISDILAAVTRPRPTTAAVNGLMALRPLPITKNTKKSQTIGGIERHDTTIAVDVNRNAPLVERRIAQSGTPSNAPRMNDARVSAIVHGTPFRMAVRSMIISGPSLR